MIRVTKPITSNTIKLILLQVYINALHWLEKHMLPCPFKAIFHTDCPGCGLQRSILALLNGDIYKSLSLYPATIPILLLFLLGFFHIKFRLKKGGIIVQYYFIFIAILIAINFLLKTSLFNNGL